MVRLAEKLEKELLLKTIDIITLKKDQLIKHWLLSVYSKILLIITKSEPSKVKGKLGSFKELTGDVVFVIM